MKFMRLITPSDQHDSEASLVSHHAPVSFGSIGQGNASVFLLRSKLQNVQIQLNHPSCTLKTCRASHSHSSRRPLKNLPGCPANSAGRSCSSSATTKLGLPSAATTRASWNSLSAMLSSKLA